MVIEGHLFYSSSHSNDYIEDLSRLKIVRFVLFGISDVWRTVLTIINQDALANTVSTKRETLCKRCLDMT